MESFTRPGEFSGAVGEPGACFAAGGGTTRAALVNDLAHRCVKLSSLLYCAGDRARKLGYLFSFCLAVQLLLKSDLLYGLQPKTDLHEQKNNNHHTVIAPTCMAMHSDCSSK